MNGQTDDIRVQDLFSVSGKTVLVTGGTAGIGEMLAGGLVDAGCNVYVVSRKPEQVDRVVSELSRRGSCSGIAGDLGTPEGIAAVVSELASREPRLHVLVNNAGATWGAPLEDYPDAAFDKVFALNVRAGFRLTVELLGQLRRAASAADPARVINLGSVEGSVVPEWENYAYPASKAALQMLGRQLARRLAGEAITVNTIAPGPVPSRMISFASDDAEYWREIERSIPLGRAGSAADLVGAAIYLSSRAGSYLTGATLPVDGGLAGIGTVSRTTEPGSD
jgi:NAD(P)-dependent dehydrogenase (short-subunit alcohol dehydrogenase family)